MASLARPSTFLQCPFIVPCSDTHLVKVPQEISRIVIHSIRSRLKQLPRSVPSGE